MLKHRLAMSDQVVKSHCHTFFTASQSLNYEGATSTRPRLGLRFFSPARPAHKIGARVLLSEYVVIIFERRGISKKRQSHNRSTWKSEPEISRKMQDVATKGIFCGFLLWLMLRLLPNMNVNG